MLGCDKFVSKLFLIEDTMKRRQIIFFITVCAVFCLLSLSYNKKMKSRITCQENSLGQISCLPNDVHETNSYQHVPNALIIGVRKGGTRALIEYLNLHSEISVCEAEQHYFNKYYALGEHWYKSSMPFNTKIILEKTPAYLVDRDTPKRVYSMNKNIKLLFIYKNPIDRLISDYNQVKRNNLGKIPFFENYFFKNGSLQSSMTAIRVGMYNIHLENWFKYFDSKQFHFVDGTNFIKDPVKTLTKIEDFFNLKHEFSRDYFYKNETTGFYCARSRETPCFAKKGHKQIYVNKEIRKKLQEYYDPFNKLFFKQINKTHSW